MKDIRSCEYCDKPLNKGKRFCSRSCSNKFCHANGKRNTSGIKGSTMSLNSLIEKYGEESGQKKYDAWLKKLSDSSSGERNPMFGRNDQTKKANEWHRARKGKSNIEVYGPERAAEIAKKQSIASSGEKNPMFGKPAPKLSGVGVKGHYKGVFFRSLLELVCMQQLELEGVAFESIEHEKIRIPYVGWNGQKMTYVPDILIKDRKHLIEVKPERLSRTKTNELKFEAAREYCRNNDLQFVIFTENSTTITKEMAVNHKDVTLLKGEK